MNWSTNHTNSTTRASISRNHTRIMKNSVKIFARGYQTRYAPITPAIAPDAPMTGTVLAGSIRTCPTVAKMPASR